uniref:Chromo domain-containing protein n=1 Tax=Eutreptiella gymnastica TaxID=73025 RepID=A0A7S4GP06_9EUGL
MSVEGSPLSTKDAEVEVDQEGLPAPKKRKTKLAVKEIKPSDEYARDNFVKVAQRMSPKASMHDILCKWERLEPWEQVTWERSSKLMKTLEKVEQANKRKRKKENAAKQQETEQTESQQVEPRSPKKHGTEDGSLSQAQPDTPSKRSSQESQDAKKKSPRKKAANIRLPPTL